MKQIRVAAAVLLLLILLVLVNFLGGQEPDRQYAGYLNINTATYEQLLHLPDMSEDMAGNIVTYREANGAFTAVDDLIKVKGFWYAYIDRIRPYVRLTGENTLREVSP